MVVDGNDGNNNDDVNTLFTHHEGKGPANKRKVWLEYTLFWRTKRRKPSAAVAGYEVDSFLLHGLNASADSSG